MFLTLHTLAAPPPPSLSLLPHGMNEELHKEEEECPSCKPALSIGLLSSLLHLTMNGRSLGQGSLLSPGGILDLDEDCRVACKNIHSRFV